MATAVAAVANAPSSTPPAAVSAVEMGARQREISVSEFFTKNRHLLGFDNPRKALLTCVKEAVDNALDASEEAGILPEVVVTVETVASDAVPPPPASQATRFRVTVVDYGPGIVRQQIPPIFAKLLYGSKFHRLRMSRGQQGIGISAAGMYAQITTGKPVQIISRTSARAPAQYFEVQIDTKKNEPRIFESKKIDWENHRGTQVTLEIEGRYQKGRASVDEYLEQTAIANPHVRLVYHTPEGDTREYPRTIDELPPQPREIKPHPYGIEFGVLLRMLHDTKSHSLAGFLAADFSRVSAALAQEICGTAKLSPDARPRNIHGADAEALYKAIQSTKIMAPPSELHLPDRREGDPPRALQADQGRLLHRGHAAARGISRQPVHHRGGSRLRQGTGSGGDDPGRARGTARRGRAAGRRQRARARHPLRQPRAPCSISNRRARPSRPCSRPPGGTTASPSRAAALPAGPMVIFVHMASVWVPFTSESKEAIADYDEIRKEIKLALQECGRRLGVFLRRRERAKSEFRRRNIFELYIEEVVEACARLKGGKLAKDELKNQLQKIAAKRTGGARTDEILGNDAGPDGLPHSIIVTADGIEGEASAPVGGAAVARPEDPTPESENGNRPRARAGAAPARPAPASPRVARTAASTQQSAERQTGPGNGHEGGDARRQGSSAARSRRRPAGRSTQDGPAEEEIGSHGESPARRERSRRSWSAWPTP